MAKKNTPAETSANTVPEGFDGETSESTAVAVTNQQSLTNTFAGKFRLAKRITLPTLNPRVGEPIIVRIEDAFKASTYVDPKKPNQKPATVCTVTDMQTGVVSMWLVSEVAHKNIAEQYGAESYVGKIFGVQKLPKRPGKNYFDFEIVELEAE